MPIAAGRHGARVRPAIDCLPAGHPPRRLPGSQLAFSSYRARRSILRLGLPASSFCSVILLFAPAVPGEIELVRNSFKQATPVPVNTLFLLSLHHPSARSPVRLPASACCFAPLASSIARETFPSQPRRHPAAPPCFDAANLRRQAQT